MSVTQEIIKRVAEDTGITVDKLAASGFLALLREKRRKIMLDRLDVLTRYGATSAEELGKKIKDGEIPEHPAWEDLIFLENLESTIIRLDEDTKIIQESS